MKFVCETPSGSIAFTIPEKIKTRPIIILAMILRIFMSEELPFIEYFYNKVKYLLRWQH